MRRHPSQPRQGQNKYSVPFFGHVLTKDGIQPDESKVKLILDWPIPENQKELQQFMGSVNYLSKFLAFLSDLHAPLQPLLKEDSEFIWADIHTAAFNCIKEHVSNDVKLQFFDSSKPLFIKVDASKRGIGAAMLQCDPIVKNSSSTEIPSNLHPISYASKTPSETESNYSNIERELLGVVFAVTHFKHFIYEPIHRIVSNTWLKNDMKTVLKLKFSFSRFFSEHFYDVRTTIILYYFYKIINF